MSIQVVYILSHYQNQMNHMYQKKISDDKAIIKTNNENDCLLCKCLDWCSWLSNIDCKKSSCCEQNIVCFMCCCSITFQ